MSCADGGYEQARAMLASERYIVDLVADPTVVQ